MVIATVLDEGVPIPKSGNSLYTPNLKAGFSCLKAVDTETGYGAVAVAQTVVCATRVGLPPNKVLRVA